MSAALRCQRTLAQTAVVEGFGYWSGQDVRVEFRPAEANSGIVFVRGDLPASPRVAARITNRLEVPRRTVLAQGPARVAMVEHVLAALYGMVVDNCVVVIDAEEMPGCDGSAKEFVDALDSAGRLDQDAPVARLVVTRRVRLGDQQSWIEARPRCDGGFRVQFELDYGADTPIGRQLYALDVTPAAFRRELATCRTFLLEHEARLLNAQGMGSRVTPRDLLIFDSQGPIDNQLRFVDECVRHKVLDVIGDLALAGCEIQGEIVAYRSGHQLNAELAGALLAAESGPLTADKCA